MSSVIVRTLVTAGVITLATVVPGISAHAVDGTVTQVTTSPAGQPIKRDWAGVSDNGRYVVFQSNLVPGSVTYDGAAVFLTDTTTGTTVMISRAPDGSVGNGLSVDPQISANGKFVVYSSYASNLTADSAGQTERQVFRYSIATGKTIRVSKSPRGELAKVFATGATISATGRYVAYMSYGHNIVPGDSNGRADVFRYDAMLDETIKVSETLSGGETDRNSSASVISPDGGYVAYATSSQNMGPSDTNASHDTYVYDVQADTTALASRGVSGSAAGKTGPTGISTGARVVAMTSGSPRLTAGDTDKEPDVFVYRARTDSVALVNVNSNNAQAGSAEVSADGRWVLYEQRASDSQDPEVTVYLLDRNTNERTDLTAPLAAVSASLSSSGAVAVFSGADLATPTQRELYLWTKVAG